MVRRRARMVFVFLFFLSTAGTAQASNLAVRLGLWHLTNPDFTQEGSLSLNRQKNFFYMEASLENPLGRAASFDLSLGTLFRGTIRYQSITGSRFVGSANVLPVSAGFSLHPLPSAGGFRPYLRAGGTVAIGNSNSGNFSGFDAFGNPVFNSKTRITAGYFGSAGLERRIFSKINLLIEGSFHQLKFSGPVAGLSNHSGYKILAGVVINYK